MAGASLGNTSDLVLLGALFFGSMFIVVKVVKKSRSSKHGKIILETNG